MDADPKPYLLPNLSDIFRGAEQGALAGGYIGAWSAPISVGLFTAWMWIQASWSRGFSWKIVTDFFDVGLGLCLMAMMIAIVGYVLGVILGFLSGGSTYLVLCPFVPAESWPEMDLALMNGMRRGAIIAQALAVAAFVFYFGLLNINFAAWSNGASDVSLFAFLGWLALVPCGLMLGGFVSVARLMRSAQA